MVNRNLVGRCGLYCGFCEVYRAYKDSRQLREEIAKKLNCRPEEVRCEGCRALDVCGWSHEKEWGTNCKILKCLNTKKLNFCYECAEYDNCQKFGELAKSCAGLGIDLRRNLQMIREGRVEDWLMEQERKWRCPRCGKPIIVSYERQNCHWCGCKLRE